MIALVHTIRELILKDHYTTEVCRSDEEKGFIAFVHELEGCSAWGETRETALREVETAIELWSETAGEIGLRSPFSILPPFRFPDFYLMG